MTPALHAQLVHAVVQAAAGLGLLWLTVMVACIFCVRRAAR